MNVDTPIMRQDRLPRDSQSQTGASGLACDIRLPDGLDSLRGDSGPVIPDVDLHRFGPGHRGSPDSNFDFSPRPAGIGGVQEHVGKRPLERVMVTPNHDFFRLNLDLNRDVWRDGGARCITHHFTDIDVGERPFLKPAKLRKRPGHLVEPTRFRTQDLDDVAKRRRCLTLESRQCELNWRQGILQLMRETSRAFAEGTKSLGLECARPSLGQFLGHRAHPVSQRLELRCAANGTRRWQGLVMSNAFRPADEFVEWSTELSTEMPCNARYYQRQQEKPDDCPNCHQWHKAVDEEFEASRLGQRLAEFSFVVLNCRALAWAQLCFPHFLNGPRTTGGNAFPRGGFADQRERAPDAHRPRYRHADRRHEGQRGENDKETGSVGELKHWLLVAGCKYWYWLLALVPVSLDLELDLDLA